MKNSKSEIRISLTLDANPLSSAIFVLGELKKRAVCSFILYGWLATVFEAGVLALVAVLVVIVAVLFGNRFHYEFSCHREIIT